MPFPVLIIGAAAVASGAFGAGKSVKAGIDAVEANNINKTANQMVQDASERVEAERNAVKRALENLGIAKLSVLNTSIPRFLKTFRQIKNVNFKGSEGLDELSRLVIDENDFEEMEGLVTFAGSVVGGAVGGVAGGAAMAFGAYSAAQAFAAASTGTAIASLSGAAATNATLAFFGGGSLAAGGLGMAGGAAVLGGIVAGPALMVMGLVAGSAADKELEKARTNKAEAIEVTEQLSAASAQCAAIRRRTNVFHNLLIRLDARFLPLIYAMEDIFATEGEDFANYSIEERKTITSCASIAVSIKSILDTPLLSDDGLLTGTSETVADSVNKTLHVLN